MLLMLFVYVPSDVPLSAGQSLVAWLAAGVALVASLAAFARSLEALLARVSRGENGLALVLAVLPCLCAGVVMAGLIFGR